MKIKNLNISIETVFKVCFIIFLFLLSLNVNFQQYFPGRYLFIISLLVNIIIFWFLRTKGKNKYKFYLVGSILIFNFLFDERFLISNYGFNSLFSYSNSLLITILIPIVLFDSKQVRLLLKNENIKIFLIITFFLFQLIYLFT